MRTVCLLYLLIKRSDAILAMSHFTALSLFNSYVIAHGHTTLRELYTHKLYGLRQRIVSSATLYPWTFMRTKRLRFVQSTLKCFRLQLLLHLLLNATINLSLSIVARLRYR